MTFDLEPSMHGREEMIFQWQKMVKFFVAFVVVSGCIWRGSLPRLEWLRVHGEHRWILQDRYWRHSHWRTIHPGLHGDCVVWHPVCHHLCPPETHRQSLLWPISWVMWIPDVAVGINFVARFFRPIFWGDMDGLPEINNGKKSLSLNFWLETPHWARTCFFI